MMGYRSIINYLVFKNEHLYFKMSIRYPMLQHGSVRAFYATAKPTHHKWWGTGIKRDPDEPGPVNI